MTEPQIPTHWHPDTYAVDEFNKVIWKQGGHALALHMQHNGQPVPGYTTSLCTREELVGVRHRIKVDKAKRNERPHEEPFTPEEEEELGRMFSDGWMRRKKPPTQTNAAFAKVLDSIYRVLIICFWGGLGTWGAVLLVGALFFSPSFSERCFEAGGGSLYDGVCVKNGVRINP